MVNPIWLLIKTTAMDHKLPKIPTNWKIGIVNAININNFFIFSVIKIKSIDSDNPGQLSWLVPYKGFVNKELDHLKFIDLVTFIVVSKFKTNIRWKLFG